MTNTDRNKLRAWQKVASAPYGTYGARKTANAKRNLALYSSGVHPTVPTRTKESK